MMSSSPQLQMQTIDCAGDLNPGKDRRCRRDQLLIFVLVFCTMAIYFRTRNFSYLQFDDPIYYDNNYLLHSMSGNSLHWAMTALIGGNWHPLTLLAELLVAGVFGPGAGTFHIACAAIHSTNVALLFLFWRRTTGRPWAAFFIAAFWGLHPLRAESVAWVAEFKDVLCGMFWLLCMLAYLRYSNRRTFAGLAMVLLLDALALLAKPMAVTLPAALLLMDYWPIQSAVHKTAKWWSQRVLEKLPLMALSLADTLIATRTQRGYEGPLSAAYPMVMRCKNAPIAVVDYLRDIFFPRHLAVFYPHPVVTGHGIPLTSAVLACALLLLITVAVVIRINSKPYLAIGWFWFLGTLMPVLGFVHAGEQQRADRYTYLPSIGITLIAVLFFSDLFAGRRVLRLAGPILATAALVALTIAATFSIDRFENSHTLFTSLRNFQPDNFLALSHYCQELQLEGNLDEAIRTGKRATELAPSSAAPHVAYATALRSAGKLPEALNEFLTALTISPNSAGNWDGLGSVRDQQANQADAAHQPDEARGFRLRAIDDFRNAIKADPDTVYPREHLAYQLALLPGHLDEAIGIWQQAVSLKPSYAQAHGDLASALLLKGDLEGAVDHFRAALANGAKNPGWETNLAWLIATSAQATAGDVQPMVAIAKDACDQTGGQQPAALDAYAACLARVGRYDDAIKAARQAIAQANASHEPAIAMGIQKRLALYQKGSTYTATDPALEHLQPPATQIDPTTRIGPTTTVQ